MTSFFPNNPPNKSEAPSTAQPTGPLIIPAAYNPPAAAPPIAPVVDAYVFAPNAASPKAPAP